MQTNFKIDPAFSIIYHDENRVEFRSGVWNITSHCLNDDTQNNILAKIILEIDENGFDNTSALFKKTNITIKECEKVIDILQQKKLLVTEKQTVLKAYPEKIVLLDDQEISKALFHFLKSKFPTIKIANISREELFFIEKHGEAVFRDNLVLEKII